MSPDPMRLLEAPDLSEAERALLETGKLGAPIAYDVAAEAARFRASLLVLGAAGAASTAAAGARAAMKGATVLAKLSTKAIVAVVVPSLAVGVGVGAYRLVQSNAGRTTASQAATAQERAPSPGPHPTPPTAGPAPATPLPEPQAAEPEEGSPAHDGTLPRGRAGHTSSSSTPESTLPTPVVLAEEAEPSVKSAPPASAVTPPAPSDAVEEMRAVARARNLIPSDPVGALRALDAIRREHPQGYFGEERRALTIFALHRAGSRDAALEQAKKFVRAYPNGPFTDKVRATVGLSPN